MWSAAMTWTFIDASLLLRRGSGGKLLQAFCQNLDQFLVVLLADVEGGNGQCIGKHLTAARVGDPDVDEVERYNHQRVEHHHPQRLLTAALALAGGGDEDEGVNIVVLIQQ